MQDNLSECYKRAVDAYNARHWDAALQWTEACLAIDAAHPHVLHLRGVVALEQDHAGDAEAWLLRAIERLPDPVFYNSLCVAQTRMKAFARATDSARAGLEQALRQETNPVDPAPFHFNMGRALQLDRKFEEAVEAYSKAVEIDPRHGHAHNNLGATLNQLGRLHDAIIHFQRAIELQPDNLVAHCNLGHALLAAGRYREAWPHFQHRSASFQDRTTGRSIYVPPEPPLPEWKGAPPRPGFDRLLILDEQGLGDTLQFCRYIPLALERFAKVTLAGPAPLQRLILDSFGQHWPNFEFIDSAACPADFGAWDCFTFLMSMPMAFDTDIDTVPAAIPYLFAEPNAAARWRARLRESDSSARPRIGIAWAGSDYLPEVDATRSLRPEQIDTLIAWPHARWISLQKPANQSKVLLDRQRSQVIDWMDEMHDFADTAALIASLDLVICADTSVAHLAGAMGKPVWLLNRHPGCWRWMRDREDTPWYPHMRLFTQAEAGNWDEVLDRVRNALETDGPTAAHAQAPHPNTAVPRTASSENR